MLVEFLGTDLSKISNELDKLMLILPKETIINPSHIEENIGISKDFNSQCYYSYKTEKQTQLCVYRK